MLLTRKSVFAAKVESTIGTAESLANADAAFNCFDFTIQPTAEFLERHRQGGFGQLAGIVGLETGTATFRTELYGDGSGGPGAWANTLLPAVGMPSPATDTYQASTAAPGAAVKTLTIGGYQDGVLKRIRGAVGNLQVVIEPGKPVSLNWTFMGAWAGVSDTAILTPTYPTRLPMLAKSAVTTIGSFNPCFSSLTIDLGNVMEPRQCANSPGGINSFVISNRNINGTLDPESKLVATYDPYGDWLDSTARAFSVVVSDSADTVSIGNIAGAQAFQITNPQEGDRNGIKTDTLNFQILDDSLEIAFEVT
jgi:hypothetical protein